MQPAFRHLVYHEVAHHNWRLSCCENQVVKRGGKDVSAARKIAVERHVPVTRYIGTLQPHRSLLNEMELGEKLNKAPDVLKDAPSRL